MPFTRQRHHGTHETQASKPHRPHVTHKIHSSQSIRHRTARSAHHTLAISLAATAFSHVPAALAKKPNQKDKATKASVKKVIETKPTGVWGWTSGAQTYLRSRPGALTAPVAKVEKHTKLFVWGKFDGWYRVETPDHVFGWVYHSYINSPDTPKIQELSHFKAKLASDRTASQPMYGSTALLSRQYALYKAPGAAKSLEKQGVRIATAPTPKKAAKNGTKSSLKLATRPATKIAPKGTPQAAMAQAAEVNARAPHMQEVSTVTNRYVRRDFASSHGHNSTSSTTQTPLSDMNEVGTVRFSPALAPSHHSNTSIAPSLPNTAHSEQNTAVAQPTTPVASTVNTTAQPVAKVGAKKVAAHKPTAEKAVPVHRISQPKTQKKVAKIIPVKVPVKVTPPVAIHAQLVKPTARPVPVVIAQVQPKAQPKPSAQSIRAQRRLAAALRRQHIKEARRAQLRVRMGNPATMVPPVASIPPISPEELLKARDAFLSSQPKNQPEGTAASTQATPAPTLSDNTSAIVSPSSFTSGQATQSLKPVTPVHLTQSVHLAKNIAAPSRGGSPRDYLRSLDHQRFGENLVASAMTYRGMPYIRGAESPNRGFDCSGLLYYLLRQRGYNPPRTASGYAHYGQAISKEQLQPGDVLLFANTYKRGISHVGLYMGNGRFIHAANSGRGVTTDLLDSSYYAHKYYGARRVK